MNELISLIIDEILINLNEYKRTKEFAKAKTKSPIPIKIAFDFSNKLKEFGVDHCEMEYVFRFNMVHPLQNLDREKQEKIENLENVYFNSIKLYTTKELDKKTYQDLKSIFEESLTVLGENK